MLLTTIVVLQWDHCEVIKGLSVDRCLRDSKDLLMHCNSTMKACGEKEV